MNNNVKQGLFNYFIIEYPLIITNGGTPICNGICNALYNTTSGFCGLSPNINK